MNAKTGKRTRPMTEAETRLWGGIAAAVGIGGACAIDVALRFMGL